MASKAIRAPATRTARGKAKGRGKAKPGAFAGLSVLGEAVRRWSLILLLLALAALGIAAAAAFGVPQAIGWELGRSIGEAGFAVKRYELRGLSRMDRQRVDRVVEQQVGVAMPLVDLEATRAKLLDYGWIEDARVSRRLPDTLVVDVVERRPAAIWQHQGQLALIDRAGVVLEPVTLEAMPDLPLVIGPAANRHAGDLNRLVAAAPELKPIMAGATWVGGRRWDVRFQSGETLALPEGQEEAVKALVRFARMDRSSQLLGRGLVRFDMRVPGKLIVRVSREPGSSVPALAPPTSATPAQPAPAGTAQTI